MTKLQKILIRFLKDNNVYYIFIRNASRKKRYSSKKTIELTIDAYLINQYLNDTDIKNYIMMICDWNNTEEGSKFWRELHDKWVSHLKKRKCKI